MSQVVLVAEDVLTLAAGRRILQCCADHLVVYKEINTKGCGNLKARMPAYISSLNACPFVVFTDLDGEPCVCDYVKSLCGDDVHLNLLFRVAEKEVESWLLADREAMADYLGVAKVKIPENTDAIIDPKRFLVELASKSKKRYVREGVGPRSAESKVGPAYNDLLTVYTNELWRPFVAADFSPSLRRACSRAEKFLT